MDALGEFDRNAFACAARRTQCTIDTATVSDAAPRSTMDSRKRGKGRPVHGGNDVGRERLLIAAEQLLRTMPPSRVSMARVAQAANADPALVRYYFGDRVTLLMAVVARVTAHGRVGMSTRGVPAVAMAEQIGKTVQLNHAVPFMHRVMIDELVQVGTAKSLGLVRDMNLDLVQIYREVLDDDDGRDFVPVDPLFLHVAVLGASNLFSSAGPVIRDFVPAGTDMDRLATQFQAFLIELVLGGLRKR